MKDYNFSEIEKKWQKFWKENKIYKVTEDKNKPKYYVLDMFPYPSGAGLHVGHPLGYIASDIYARYKRLKGFNVLHPMGYDAFGLPAEQYAIQTGQHPAITTGQNIKRYREQLDKIGFSFDWDREVRTSDPNYYKWTQWIFIKLFHSFYNTKSNKAEQIENLIHLFEKEGFHAELSKTLTGNIEMEIPFFSAKEWKSFDEKKKEEILMNFRMAYLAESYVNWCPALGTVLANDEVKDGVSERGGYPVERKLMMQWSMRITAYADRLLTDLDALDWTESLKESQRNWIGKSEGCSIQFHLSLDPSPKERGTPFITTSPDHQGFYTTDPQLWNLLRDRALQMRKNPTPAEDALWQVLRNDLTTYHFRRQHIVDRYIADFVCLSARTIIEVDGDIHDHQIEEDENRTAHLNKLGYEILRFRNEEVLADPYKVAKKIKSILDTKPNPHYQKEESELNTELNSPLHGDEMELNSDTNSPLLWRGAGGEVIEVFTTRPDTIFGVSFVTLAPEHELVEKITTYERKKAVDEYVIQSKNRSERERMADVKKISGEFTGAYVTHPFSGKQIPVWVGDYVLAGYGTGAVMAVPAHDSRDFAFAKHFGLEMPVVILPPVDWDFADQSYDEKNGKAVNSDFLNGLETKEAIKKAIQEIEYNEIGKGKTNYRLRDAVFGRQRYWGEPIPIYYKDGIAKTVDEKDLPILLPEIDKYLPTETGEPPLARAKDWKYRKPLSGSPQRGEDATSLASGEGKVLPFGEDLPAGQAGLGGAWDFELSTMPGWAGSSWYFLRYMDPKNTNEFVSKEAVDYWKQVDLYIGGSEHATGHLLYVRFWTKFLFDLGLIPVDEPAKKLINQGMILGLTSKIFITLRTGSSIYHKGLQDEEEKEVIGIFKDGNGNATLIDDKFYIPDKVHRWIVPIEYTDEGGTKLYEEKYEKLKSEFEHFKSTQLFKDLHLNWIEDDKGKYLKLNQEVEKMSKSKYNVVTPDTIIDDYGADTLRLYEMFLGPLEQSKPWSTQGIEGVHRFLKKLWKLFAVDGKLLVTDEEPNKKELKSIHKLIKKVGEDVEGFSFNTSVSSFMICLNELTDLKCSKRKILSDYLICLSPYAPHIAEELWQALGNKTSIVNAQFPVFKPEYLVEDSFSYPVSINGKHRTNIEFSMDAAQQEVEQAVISNEIVLKWLEGKQPKKIVFVKGRIINIVS